MIKLRELKIQIPNFIQGDISLDPKMLRLGLFLGFLIYGAFGFLDLYAMPSNYRIAWIIRYAFIVPFLAVSFILSYYKPLYKHTNTILLLLLSFGQIGIIIMIGLSKPGDLAFYTYYAGLILVMLWASFVFKLNFWTTIYFVFSTVILFNLTAFIKQDIPSHPFGANELSVLLNNNFFLVSSGILVVIGAYQLEKQGKEIGKAHQELIEEKIALELSKRKAEESDRLKSAFLANMSHEIRTPLNCILGFTELFTNPHLDEDQSIYYSKLIEDSGNNLLNIINNILDISKIEAGQVEVNKNIFTAQKLIESVQQEFELKALGKGIRLIVDSEMPKKEIQIINDEAKIKQVLINFVGNAIKFTEKGSIELGMKASEMTVEFYVKDSGIGIPAIFIPCLFERFRQVEKSHTRKYGGNGLGLSISKSLIELLGGTINVKSEPGKGSTFYFSLPKK